MRNALQLEGLVFAGESPFAERLRVQVRRIAPHFRTVLLIGEPGTGKGEIARELHRLSPVADGPFLACSAEEFAAGDVEEVRFGTLYLQGLGGLRAPHQEELLKRLHRLDARAGSETRLILASTAGLRGVVASGRMRSDLYARVASLEVRVARLSERLEDLPAMLRALPLSAEASSRLAAHAWPGNLRELREVMAHVHSAANGQTAGLEHLPALLPAEPIPPPPELGDARLDVVMKRHVADVLERCAGNKLRAAEMLGISRSTLYRMLDTPTGDV